MYVSAEKMAREKVIVGPLSAAQYTCSKRTKTHAVDACTLWLGNK